MRKAGLILLCALLVGCGSSEKKKRAPRRTALSPIGGYVVTSEATKENHEIKITRPGEKRPILEYPFRQQVDVAWAPDESRIAVVDLVLQNETHVVIFDLPEGRPLFRLTRDQVCQFNPELPCGSAYSHVFFSNVVWLAPDRIQVTVDMMNPLEPNLPAQIRGMLVAYFPLPAPR